MPSVVTKRRRDNRRGPVAAAAAANKSFSEISADVSKAAGQFMKLFDAPHRRAKNVTRLQAPCPRPGCGGVIQALLAGKRRHLHMGCSNHGSGCYYWMMS